MSGLGARIQEMRRLRGMPQRVLAKAAGVGVPHISHIEHDRQQPSLSVLEAIAKTLDVPLSELVPLTSRCPTCGHRLSSTNPPTQQRNP